MVGRWVSFWEGLFSGSMLNFRGVEVASSWQIHCLWSYMFATDNCMTSPQACHEIHCILSWEKWFFVNREPHTWHTLQSFPSVKIRVCLKTYLFLPTQTGRLHLSTKNMQVILSTTASRMFRGLRVAGRKPTFVLRIIIYHYINRSIQMTMDSYCKSNIICHIIKYPELSIS